MIILDQIRTATDWGLRVPPYHRGHLSLYPATTVYLAPVPPDRPGAAHFVELFGTTIQPDSWPHVFRVSISLRDGPGVLHEALASIARHGGNVLQLDSTSVDHELRHEVEMVVDFAGLDVPAEQPEDRSAAVQGVLLGDCCRHVAPDNGAFRLRVRPITSLHRATKRLQRVRSTHQKVVRAQMLPRGILQLPDQIVRLVARGGLFEGSGELNLPFKYFVTSDTKDRVFRVFLIPMNEVLVWCAIRHQDAAGALSAITDAIRGPRMSVLTAFNRVQRHLGVNWFEVILSKANWKELGQAAAESEVRDALGQRALALYKLGVFLDPTQANQEMKAAALDDAQPRNVVMRTQRPLAEWLKERERELVELRNARHHAQDVAARQEFSNSIRAIEAGTRLVRHATGLVTPQLFLSLEHTDLNEALEQIARTWCSDRGVKVDVVKHSRDKPLIRSEVYDRIREASHFLGIWTPSSKAGDMRPSPWVVWELAQAHALRKHYRVLMKEGTSTVDYMQIYPERFYRVFRDAGEFKSGLEAVLSQMLEPGDWERLPEGI